MSILRAEHPTETDKRLAEELRQMVNLERVQRSIPLLAKSLPAFRYLDKLDKVAQDTVHHWIDTAVYGHVDREGKKVGDRLAAAGFKLYLHSENIAFSDPNYAGKVFEQFMGSTIHRMNLLNNGYKYVGIGTGICLEPSQFWNTKDQVMTTLGPTGRLWCMVFYTPPTTA